LSGVEHSDSTPLISGAASGSVRLSLYVMIAVVLMVSDHRSDYLDRLRSALSLAVYPVLQLVELPSRFGQWLNQTWSDRTAMQAHSQELELRWLLAQSQITQMQALQAENQRLRRLLDTSPRLGTKVLVAELLRVDLDPHAHRVTLNKGRHDDVYRGQPLADAGGIIGQIETLSEYTSVAMLISDPGHAIPVTVNRTGLRTIAYGTGETDQLLLRDVSTSANVISGDLLLASGMGGRFPAGFPVATVTEAKRELGSAFQIILAQPLAALKTSREVLLVWPNIDPVEPIPDVADQ
jgi:rod shape-determining protein MreC